MGNLVKQCLSYPSEIISFCYAPFHDQIFSNRLLSHGIVNGWQAGLMGAGVSFLANKTYRWLMNREKFSCLKFDNDQHWVKTTGQAAAKCVVHVAIGTSIGCGLGLAATGFAVGFAAFLGPQLVHLIFKIAIFVKSKIFPEKLGRVVN